MPSAEMTLAAAAHSLCPPRGIDYPADSFHRRFFGNIRQNTQTGGDHTLIRSDHCIVRGRVAPYKMVRISMANGSAMPQGGSPSTQGNGMLREVMANNWSVDRGMRRAATARRQHWHNFSIGISLSEAMILVLVLAALALGVRTVQVQKEARDARIAYQALQLSMPALKPFLETLRQDHQLQANDVQQVVQKLSRTLELERTTADLALANADLRSQLAAQSSVLESAARREVPAEAGRPDRPGVIGHGGEKASAALTASAHEALPSPFDNFRIADDFSPIAEGHVPAVPAVPAKEAKAPRAEPAVNLAVPPRMRARPGCVKPDFLRAQVGRPAGQLSVWCP